MHCFDGNLFGCKSDKNYKIRLRFHKANLTSIKWKCAVLGGPPCILRVRCVTQLAENCLTFDKSSQSYVPRPRRALSHGDVLPCRSDSLISSEIALYAVIILFRAGRTYVFFRKFLKVFLF